MPWFAILLSAKLAMYSLPSFFQRVVWYRDGADVDVYVFLEFEFEFVGRGEGGWKG